MRTTMDNDKLLKLLGAIATKNKQAFDQLYHLTSGKLMAVSMQLLKNKDLAQEALQEAYVSIWHKASEFRSDRGNVITWMISIVRYRALDIIRANKTRTNLRTHDHDLSLGQANNPVQDTFSIERDKIKLDKCLDDLNPQQADVISLAYFRGFTHKEVCHYMSKPLGTVKSWIRRGLQSLKRCLES